MSVFLCCLSLLVSLAPQAQAITVQQRQADASTANNWQLYFGEDVKTSVNSGTVWSDKSVFDSVDVLNDALGINLPASAISDQDRFLVALTAIASSKSVRGHSTIPTDTVFVLDLSGSMASPDSRVKNMIPSLNIAIQKLMDLNVENRVGVVMYFGSDYIDASPEGSSTVILPLGRYVASSDYSFSHENENGVTEIYNEFFHLDTLQPAGNYYPSNTDTTRFPYNIKVVAQNASKNTVDGVFEMHNYGTYIQNGLLRAWYEVFSMADVQVNDGGDPLQLGARRMPVLVLMSDGAPTATTSSFTNVEESNGGNSRLATTSDSMGFVTQLTASWVRRQMEKHYNGDGQGHKPLFYTLGLQLDDTTVPSSVPIAKSVMNPIASTPGINELWSQYLALSPGQSLSPEFQQPGDLTDKLKHFLPVDYNADAVNQFYVNRYFSASQAQELFNAFESIVQEIVLQSLYYPTNSDVATPEYGGYLTFIDDLGLYMEVKDIKGIILDNKLYTGVNFARRLNDYSDNGMGSVTNPSVLGREFIHAMCSRLYLTTAQAMQFVDDAYNDKQLYYNSETDYGNSLSWYVDVDGKFIRLWKSTDGEEDIPANAVYLCRSYAYLNDGWKPGETHNLMYVSVQVHTRLTDGHNTVVLKIPASMIPLVASEFTLPDPTQPQQAISREPTSATPIRLLYEVGLREGITEHTVAQIVGDNPTVKNADGTYTFRTNRVDMDEMNMLLDSVTTPPHPLPSQYKNTIVFFQPSMENERYYYITDHDLYVRNDSGQYVRYNGAKPDSSQQAFYVEQRLYDWTEGNQNVKESAFFERVTSLCLQSAQKREDGWVIPRGAVRRQTNQYEVLKVKDDAVSPVRYSHFPFVLDNEHSRVIDAATLLGNNGMLVLKPAVVNVKVEALKQVLSADNSVHSPEGFLFELTEVDGNGQSIAPSLTATSARDGSITFGLSYDSSDLGMHHYLLTERSGDDTLIDYSDAQYRFTVQVDYDQSGVLQAQGKWSEEDGIFENGKPVFQNFYIDHLPQTGDTTPLGLLFTLCVLSSAGLLLFRRRKRRV